MYVAARFVRSVTGVGVVGAVLVTAAPDPAVLRTGVADPEQWVARDGLDLVLAHLVGAVAWLAALWLTAGFLLVAGSRLPGAAGRASAALARGALPAGLRRTAAVALGASLATSTLPAVSFPRAAAEGWSAPSAVAPTAPQLVDRLPSRAELTGHPPAARVAPDLASSASAVDWPLPAALAVDWPLPTAPVAGSAAALGQPVARPSGTQAVDWPKPADDLAGEVDWPVTARPDVAAVTEQPRPQLSAAAYPAGSAQPVIVAPGDTLWSIASRRLGPGAPAPAVAAEWRRWHAANRAEIGPDPRRLRPGTALQPPAG